ncbi:MAG: transposase [Pirellulales bacterium]|nr:transposase [Pirellulales bacterium]
MPEAPSAEFVAAMEDVLDVYHRPYDPQCPVVRMDEASKQLIAEVRQPLPAQPGRTAKYDSEYERRGTANFFMAVEPLAGKRTVRVTDRRTKIDWAQFICHLLLVVYAKATKVVLVMDNLNTHGIGSLYEAFAPATPPPTMGSRGKMSFRYAQAHFPLLLLLLPSSQKTLAPDS